MKGEFSEEKSFIRGKRKNWREKSLNSFCQEVKRRLERIKDRICRFEVSVLFNQTCTHIHTHIHVNTKNWKHIVLLDGTASVLGKESKFLDCQVSKWWLRRDTSPSQPFIPMLSCFHWNTTVIAIALFLLRSLSVNLKS